MGTREELLALRPLHHNLVGIDSDGCVFDSMTVKQTTCFHPAFIGQWELQPAEAAVREHLEFVNLYSRSRGQDRFICFRLAVKRMETDPRVRAAGVKLPDIEHLSKWLDGGPPYGNDRLEAAIDGADQPELRASESLGRVLSWSLEVDRRVRALDPIPPFPHARRFLELVGQDSDAIVVSSTPLASLRQEWLNSGIAGFVRFICSKDIGTKVDHLRMATQGDKYAMDRVLMIGDAAKDLASAREVGARFYPINPGAGDACWQRLIEDHYAKFLSASYTEEMEAELVSDFLSCLPE